MNRKDCFLTHGYCRGFIFSKDERGLDGVYYFKFFDLQDSGLVSCGMLRIATNIHIYPLLVKPIPIS